MKIINFYTLFFFTINGIAQQLSPLELHFEKDYQVRNFYNSKVILSQLDISNDSIEIPTFKLMHVTSPGCEFKKSDGLLNISNNTK